MRKGMEPRRRRPPQETVVELGETTVFEEAGGRCEAPYGMAEHPTGSKRSGEPDAPGRKNDYKGTGLQKI